MNEDSAVKECGNCAYYLKSECPRGYDYDRELWRKKAACEIFQPKTKEKSGTPKTEAKEKTTEALRKEITIVEETDEVETSIEIMGGIVLIIGVINLLADAYYYSIFSELPLYSQVTSLVTTFIIISLGLTQITLPLIITKMNDASAHAYEVIDQRLKALEKDQSK